MILDQDWMILSNKKILIQKKSNQTSQKLMKFNQTVKIYHVRPKN
jgi:hypothetical protein